MPPPQRRDAEAASESTRSEVFEQPRVDLPNTMLHEGCVAIDIGQVSVNAWNLAGEPLAVPEGNKPIVPPVPQLHGDADRF